MSNNRQNFSHKRPYLIGFFHLTCIEFSSAPGQTERKMNAFRSFSPFTVSYNFELKKNLV